MIELAQDPKDLSRFLIKDPLVSATFLERPNRFVAVIDVEGRRVTAHVPDPGRLKELLVPGAPLWVKAFGPDTHRKHAYSLQLVASPDQATWVSVNTQLPNRLARLLLQRRCLPQYADYQLVRPEVSYGESRFDFLLRSDNTQRPHLVEVKSVSLVHADKTALFPDAPTVRGTRHVRELIHAAQTGDYEASVLFMVQRDDARCVIPFQERDPDFYQAVADAMASGVRFSAITNTLTPTHIHVSLDPIPVGLTREPVLPAKGVHGPVGPDH